MMRWIALVLVAAAAPYDVSDVVLLSVDRTHLTDTITVPIPDDGDYVVTRIDAAGLRSFCLVLNATPQWQSCFRAGTAHVTPRTNAPWQGGDKAGITLGLQSPVQNDTARLDVLVRIWVSRDSGNTTKEAP